MKHLYIHTDCKYFAGCERLLPLIWNNEDINSVFRITLSYRKSKRYELELKQFLCDSVAAKPIFKSMQLSDFIVLLRRTSNSRFHRSLNFFERVFAVAFLYPLFLYEVAKLMFVFVRDRPDVLHINNGGYPGARSARAAACAGRICRIPMILMVVNNLAVPTNSLTRQFDWPIDFLVRRSVSKFLTASTYANNSLVETLGLKSGQAQVIPNAVAIPNISETKTSIRERMACEPSTIVVGVVAILEERKGHQVLFDALLILLNDYPALADQLIVWIIGDGSLASSLMAAGKKIGNGELIRFLGYRYDYLNLVSAMDIAVLASISDEDSPLSTIEAMSLGIPVVVSDYGGLSDQVVNGENGLLFPVGDSPKLANALYTLINQKEIRITMGKTALATYHSNYSVNEFISSYLSLYLRQSKQN
jgi:glycosyltransferase involved in cell wall biosynthesis